MAVSEACKVTFRPLSIALDSQKKVSSFLLIKEFVFYGWATCPNTLTSQEDHAIF